MKIRLLDKFSNDNVVITLCGVILVPFLTIMYCSVPMMDDFWYAVKYKELGF